MVAACELERCAAKVYFSPLVFLWPHMSQHRCAGSCHTMPLLLHRPIAARTPGSYPIAAMGAAINRPHISAYDARRRERSTMGAWGVEPWESDAAADWFARFFEDVDVNARIGEAFLRGEHEEIRAGCFLLGTLGRVFVWPGDLDELKSLLDEGISWLRAMIDPADTRYEADQWREPEEFIRAIQEQIRELEARRAGIA